MFSNKEREALLVQQYNTPHQCFRTPLPVHPSKPFWKIKVTPRRKISRTTASISLWMTNRSRSPSKFPIGLLKEIQRSLYLPYQSSSNSLSLYQRPSVLLQKIHWNWKFGPTQGSNLANNKSILHWLMASLIRSSYTLHQSDREDCIRQFCFLLPQRYHCIWSRDDSLRYLGQ